MDTLKAHSGSDACHNRRAGTVVSYDYITDTQTLSRSAASPYVSLSWQANVTLTDIAVMLWKAMFAGDHELIKERVNS
jgi:hypothetical protein